MIFDDVRQIALSFPHVEEHLVFGSPTFRIGKRYLAGIAKIDPDTLVLKVPNPLEREFLLQTEPHIYYLTDHYASFQAVLMRLPVAYAEEFYELFEEAWRTYAPKRVVANYQRVELSDSIRG